VSDESRAVGLTADELRLLLLCAAQHSPRSLALVSLVTFCGLRISEALNAEIRDYRFRRVLAARRPRTATFVQARGEPSGWRLDVTECC
jgi:integrase